MDKMFRNKKILLFFLLPALVIYLLFIPAPAIISVLLSLTKWDLVGAIKFIGLENYRFLFTDDGVFGIAARNSLVFVLASIVMQLPMAFFLANILSRSVKGKNIFRNIIFLPVTFSGVAVALMFYFIYQPDAGLLNQLLRLLGIKANLAWLGNENTALMAVIATLAWQWIGYHMVIYLAGISSIPDDLIDAAKIDGCSEGQVTRHVIFPMLIPVIQISLILITTSSLKAFDMIYIMTFGGPNHASEVLASHMYTKTFSQMKYGYGSAISTLLMLLCIFSTVIINRLFREKAERKVRL